MARLNLLDPANEAKSSEGGSRFKEGNVKVVHSVFKVHQNKVGEGQTPPPPALVKAWTVERLDEDLEPLTDDDGNPIGEVLTFGAGGKSLASVHPGSGDTPDDEEPSDLGDEIDTEGNTIYIVNDSFRIHEKSGLMKLTKSMAKAGWKPEYNRMWAPDDEGLVCFMKSEIDTEMKIKGKDGKEFPVSYKVVDKIHTAPYEKKNKGAAKGAAPAAKGPNPADAKAQELLKGLVDSESGTMTRKALNSKITTLLTTLKVDPKLHVPTLVLVKDDKYLAKHADGIGYTLDADDEGKVLSITFGEEEE